MQLRKLALLPALVLALAAAGATADDKVGTVKFETSCSPVVQAEFERAVAMLHSFWFSASTDAFVVIAQKDPGFATPHWAIAQPGSFWAITTKASVEAQDQNEWS